MKRLTRNLTCLTAAVSLLLISITAFAQQTAFEYNYTERAEVGKGKPSVTLTATDDVLKGNVKIIRNDGKVIRKNLKRMRAGQSQTIELKQGRGTYTYRMEIEAKLVDDIEVNNAVGFKVTYYESIKLDAKPTDLDLDKNILNLRVNRPLKTAEIEAFDEDGNSLGIHIIDISKQGKNLKLKLPEQTTEIGSMRVKVLDESGFWASANVKPFWITIPHQEIDFETGKSTWPDEQESRLVDTLQEIKRTMQQYGHTGLELQLYIAGYTDTVGSSESNLALSNARATSIAKWFVKNGLPIPVYVQGFGEEVLAKPTPDNTDEAANRRAIYLLGTTRPGLTKDMPRRSWRRVR